jgi:hypothetical protein
MHKMISVRMAHHSCAAWTGEASSILHTEGTR